MLSTRVVSSLLDFYCSCVLGEVLLNTRVVSSLFDFYCSRVSEELLLSIMWFGLY